MLNGVIKATASKLSLIACSVPNTTQKRMPIRRLSLMKDSRAPWSAEVELLKVRAIPWGVQQILLGVKVIRRSLQPRCDVSESSSADGMEVQSSADLVVPYHRVHVHELCVFCGGYSIMRWHYVRSVAVIVSIPWKRCGRCRTVVHAAG